MSPGDLISVYLDNIINIQIMIAAV